MSLLTDLFSMFETRGMGELAGALGQSDHSISTGMQTAMATVLGGIASKSNSPGMLQKILELAPAGAMDTGATDMSNAMTDPGSPLMSAGKRILSTLFGGSEGRLTQALGSDTGLSSGTMSSLMAMAAPMVVSFLGRWANARGLSAAGLGSVLQREAPAIRAALPSSVTNLLGPIEHEVTPLATQVVPERSSTGRWVVPLILLALIPAIWLLSHARKPAVETPPVASGTANRSVPEIPVTTPSLPGKLDLHFNTSSMELRPDAQSRLRDFATAMSANPNARISVNGYTDSSGQPATNLRLSQERADAVKADLVRMGIPSDRITAKGLGEQDPIADNSTPEGREFNRRVSVEISN